MRTSLLNRVIFCTLIVLQTSPASLGASSTGRLCLSAIVGVCAAFGSGCQTHPFFEAQAVTAADRAMLGQKLKASGATATKALQIDYYPWMHADSTRSREYSWSRISDVIEADVLEESMSHSFSLLQQLQADRPEVVFQEGMEPYYDMSFERFDYLRHHISDLYADESISDREKRRLEIRYSFHSKYAYDVRRAFPDGIPEALEDFSNEQKVVLYNISPAKILFALGELKELRGGDPVVKDFEFDHDLVQPYAGTYSSDVYSHPEWLHMSFEVRETNILARMIQLREAGEIPGRVALIYGSAHQFEGYDDQPLLRIFRR